MESFGKNLFCLLILSIPIVLSLDAAIGAEDQANIGANSIKIISVYYLSENQWLQIANQGFQTANLTGWTLMNMANQTYSFPANFVLKAGSAVKVHSGMGTNTESDLYNSTLLWNKNGDNATLKDASGKIVAAHKFPVKVTVNVP